MQVFIITAPLSLGCCEEWLIHQKYFEQDWYITALKYELFKAAIIVSLFFCVFEGFQNLSYMYFHSVEKVTMNF